MIEKHYRADIDGLRAIAVLGVILFHAGLPLTGGYVGVDVFFVISGYLITQIILRDCRNDKFSLKQFWVKRIRRIIPAAFVVTVTTLIAGCYLLDSKSLVELAKSAVASSGMLSNFFFWSSSGYFSQAAELQPLLHTWSLSVEEQFYLFYPILLPLLLRFKEGKHAKSILLLFTLMSLVLGIWGVYFYPSATFYLLPTRAWELGTGALLATRVPKTIEHKPSREVMAILGLLAVLVPMFLFKESTLFPGAAAIVPVVGATLIIGVNTTGPTLVKKLLSFRPLVLVGLVSYSLYLWHWPIFAFSKHIFIHLSGVGIFAALVLIFVISFMSWRLIESPFRSRKCFSVAASAFKFAIVVNLIILVFSVTLYFKKGFPLKEGNALIEIQRDVTWRGSEYQSSSPSGVRIGKLGNDEASPDFVFWGDSHGMALANVVDSVAKENNLSCNALLSSGKPPVTGLWKPLQGSNVKDETIKLNQARLNWIISSGAKNVIIVARWQVMIGDLLDTELDARNGKTDNYSMVIDRVEEEPSRDNSSGALLRQVTKMQQTLERHEIKLWIVLQAPSVSHTDIARTFYLSKKYPLFNTAHNEWDTRKEDYETARSLEVSLFRQLDSKYVDLVDPLDSFYSEGENRLRIYSDKSYYRDDDHLSYSGAEFYFRPLLTRVISKIRDVKQ